MRVLFFSLFALAALGEGVHITVGYLRALRGLPAFRGSRFLHWFLCLGLFVLWLLWNRFRTLP